MELPREVGSKKKEGVKLGGGLRVVGEQIGQSGVSEGGLLF